VISHQPWDNASAVRTGPGCWAYPDMLGKAHGHKPVLVKALHLMRFPLHHSRGFHSFSHLTLTRIWIRRGETHYRGGEPTVVRGGQSALWRLGDRLRAANLGARPRQVRQRVFLRCHLFGIKKCHHFTKTGSGHTERTRSKRERHFLIASDEVNDKIWPIITNKAAIRVSQSFAEGERMHPGGMVRSWKPATPTPSPGEFLACSQTQPFRSDGVSHVCPEPVLVKSSVFTIE
jgi:hypothetical protein